MGEVEASNIHASPQQLLDDLHRTGCWPQGAHHLQPAVSSEQPWLLQPAHSLPRLIVLSIITLVLHTEEGVPASTASRPSCTIFRFRRESSKGLKGEGKDANRWKDRGE